MVAFIEQPRGLQRRTDLARYGQAAFKDKAVARLLPPPSATLEVVARETGIGAGTLERRREDAPGLRP
jgi:hypothetical protein